MSVAWEALWGTQTRADPNLAFASTYRYGKTVAKALSIAMHLAQHWDRGCRVTALELSRDQDLPHPWVARLLGYLAQAGVVRAYRGPGGGYVLSKEPGAVSLWEVVSVFQRDEIDHSIRDLSTEHGLGVAIQATNQILRDYLERTTLSVFVTESVSKALEGDASISNTWAAVP